MNTKNPEQGSAIIWILIAVALFAALNFAFNSGSRTSTSVLDDAEASAYANQIIAYGNEVKAAVKRLQLRGCSDTEISFENNVLAGYTNPNAPTNKSCHVFDIAGGGLNHSPPLNAFKGPSANSYSSIVNGIVVTGAGSDCGTPECTDLVLVFRLSSNSSSATEIENARKLCLKINEAAGNNPLATEVIWGDDTPSTSTFHRFKGSYQNFMTVNDPLLNGKKSYCGKVNSSIYSYQNVIIPR